MPEQHVPRAESKGGYDGVSRPTIAKRVKRWGKTLPTGTKRTHRTPFTCLTYTWRILFTAIHMGVLALVTYYYAAQRTGRVHVFGSEPGFGSRFLFSAVGKVVSLFWSDFFISESVRFLFRYVSHMLDQDMLDQASNLLLPPRSRSY